MNFFTVIPPLFLLMTLVSCYRKDNTESLSVPAYVQEVYCQQDIEYLLGDITLPLAITITYVERSEHCVMVKFNSQQSLKALRDFYLLDCERLGWNNISNFSNKQQTKLVFEKPQRVSTITLFDTETGCSVEIYAGERTRSVYGSSLNEA